MRPVRPGRALRARDVAASSQVVDASAILPCLFPDEADDFSEQVGASLGTIETWVPSIWRVECANAIVMAHRRGRISAQRRIEIAADLEDTPVLMEDRAPTAGALVDLACRFGLTAYDAAYLELAVRRAATLVTRDERLAAAARAARHPVRYRRARA